MVCIFFYLFNLLDEIGKLMMFDISNHCTTLGSIKDVLLWFILKWRAQYTIANL